MAGIFSVD